MAGGRTILAKVILSLQDRLSGPAASATKNLQALNSELNKFGTINKTAGEGLALNLRQAQTAATGLSQSLSGLNRSRALFGISQDAGRAGASVERLKSSLTGLRAEASAPMRLRFDVDRSGLNRAQGDIRRLRQEAQRPIVAPPSGPGGPGSPVVPGRRYGGGAVGPLAAGNTLTNRTQRGSTWSAQQGADQMREDARAMVAGIPADARDAILRTAADMSRRFPSIRQAAAQEVLRETFFSSGGPRRGGAANMQALAPDLGAAFVNLQNKVGPRGAIDQLTGFMRAGQNLGFADDVPRMRQLLDALVRAQAVEGKEFNFRDLFTFARRSKSAGLSLSDDFLMNVAPALIADMTPASAGVALGTLLSRQTAGQNAQAADRAQREYGIRNDQGLVNNETLVRNPFAWIEQTLIPALQAKGVNIDDAGALGRVLPQLFRDQTAQGLITRMIAQREEFRDAMESYKNAMPSRQAAEALRTEDPYVALAGATAQAANAMAEVSKPIISAVIPALNSFAEGLNGVARFMQANPQFAPYISGAAVVGAGGAALAGTLLTLRGIGAALGLGGASAAGGTASGLAGSATALGSILRILPIAGAILGAGSVAGGPIGETFKGVRDGEQHNFGRRIRRGAEGVARKGRDERFGPLVSPEEQGPPMPPQMHPQYQRMLERRDQLQRQIEELRAGGEPAANSPRGQMLSNLSAELATLSTRISEAEAAVRQAGQSLGNATAQGVQSAGPEAYSAGASVGQRVLEGLRSALGGVGGGGYAPPRGGQEAPGRALGGPVTAGRLYTVGEEGPELFRPGANGSIIPNHATGNGTRSQRVVVNMGGITINGGNAQEIADQIADRVKSAFRGAFSDTEMSWG